MIGVGIEIITILRRRSSSLKSKLRFPSNDPKFRAEELLEFSPQSDIAFIDYHDPNEHNNKLRRRSIDSKTSLASGASVTTIVSLSFNPSVSSNK